jgi:hypothetical protein
MGNPEGSLSGVVSPLCVWSANFVLDIPQALTGTCDGTFTSPTSFAGTGSVSDGIGTPEMGNWTGVMQ